MLSWGGGWGKPLPRAGEEGVVLIVLTEERESSLDHLSPRGLVGLNECSHATKASLESSGGPFGVGLGPSRGGEVAIFDNWRRKGEKKPGGGGEEEEEEDEPVEGWGRKKETTMKATTTTTSQP